MTNLMDINYRKEHMMMFYDTKSSIHYGFTQPLFPVWDAWEKHTKTMVYHVLTMAHIENISRFGAQASQNMVIGPT